ncbi:MAG TPA: hypothetical protein VFC03_19345 [Acidimicrobiales bacterium]|nr:hypothetical protein [Acidimicrobiales bacterium]
MPDREPHGWPDDRKKKDYRDPQGKFGARHAIAIATDDNQRDDRTDDHKEHQAGPGDVVTRRQEGINGIRCNQNIAHEHSLSQRSLRHKVRCGAERFSRVRHRRLCGAYAAQLPGVIIDNEWLGEVPIVAGLLDGCVVLGSGTV